MSYTADETYDVYHELRVFARKEHECDSVLCSEPIRKGDPYWRISVVYDGHARTIKRCVRCQHIHEHLRALGGGETWPQEDLGCGLDYKEEWGREPPAEIAALAFWKPGDPLPCDLMCVKSDDRGWPKEPRCQEYPWKTNVTAECVRSVGDWQKTKPKQNQEHRNYC